MDITIPKLKRKHEDDKVDPKQMHIINKILSTRSCNPCGPSINQFSK